MITTINIVDGSTLGDNLITSLQIDYMSSVLIQSFQLKSLKMTKNTLHLLAIRQVVSRHCFSNSLCKETVLCIIVKTLSLKSPRRRTFICF